MPNLPGNVEDLIRSAIPTVSCVFTSYCVLVAPWRFDDQEETESTTSPGPICSEWSVSLSTSELSIHWLPCYHQLFRKDRLKGLTAGTKVGMVMTSLLMHFRYMTLTLLRFNLGDIVKAGVGWSLVLNNWEKLQNSLHQCESISQVFYFFLLCSPFLGITWH